MYRTIFVMLFPAVVILSIASCGKSTEYRITEMTAAPGRTASDDHDGDEAAIRTSQDEMQISADDGMALAEDFPGDVYVSTGHSVKKAMEGAQATMVQVAMTSRVNDLLHRLASRCWHRDENRPCRCSTTWSRECSLAASRW